MSNNTKVIKNHQLHGLDPVGVFQLPYLVWPSLYWPSKKAYASLWMNGIAKPGDLYTYNLIIKQSSSLLSVALSHIFSQSMAVFKNVIFQPDPAEH